MKLLKMVLKTVKKHPEMAPLVGICGLAVTAASAYFVYMTTKADVIFDRKKVPPWDRIDVTKSQKLITVNKGNKEMPEFDEMREKVGVLPYNVKPQ